MGHFHLMGLITFEILVLIASVFLVLYVNIHLPGKWYKHLSRIILWAVHLILIITIVHGVIHHVKADCNENSMYKSINEHHLVY